MRFTSRLWRAGQNKTTNTYTIEFSVFARNDRIADTWQSIPAHQTGTLRVGAKGAEAAADWNAAK
jgi:hypothetical protein